MKNCHLRARLPETEYQALKYAADTIGLTISEHVRNVLLRDRQALDQQQFLEKIDLKLTGTIPATASVSTDQNEPLLMELLFLTRELVAERNPQALGRVSQQLTSLYPQRKKL